MDAHVFISGFSFWLGAVIGSFLNVVVWRVPRGESLVSPGSHCPKCGHEIRPWENIPILSWLFLRGRCSACHQPISWRYPAGEAAVGLLFLFIFIRVDHAFLPLSTLLGWWWFAGAMLSAARIDFEHRFIPNLITYSGIIVALALAACLPDGRPTVAVPQDPEYGAMMTARLVQAIQNALPGGIGVRLAAVADCLAGALLGAVLLGAANLAGSAALKAWKRHRKEEGLPEEALGWGDVKLLAMCGAFLGADAVVYILTGGVLLGFLWGVGMLVVSHFRQKKHADAAPEGKPGHFLVLPLAPFLAVPALLWTIAGNWMYLLYLLVSG
jgi:leader peptidase (prepilin peptidase)/N-methyltransferase